MSDEISLMVFAAGLGTRMGDLIRDKPKPLIEVGGRALLDHALSLRTDICPVKTDVMPIIKGNGDILSVVIR